MQPPFSHRATALVGLWVGVARNANLIGFISRPVDIAFMMLGDEHTPLGLREFPDALSDLSLLIHIPFLSSFTLDISACIHGIGQHAVDRVVGGSGPLDVRQLDRLQGKT